MAERGADFGNNPRVHRRQKLREIDRGFGALAPHTFQGQDSTQGRLDEQNAGELTDNSSAPTTGGRGPAFSSWSLGRLGSQLS